jgi:NAD-specific glutamate dehydrogenase
MVSGLAAAGVDAGLAERLVQFDHTDEALEIAYLAQVASVPLTTAAQVYVDIALLVDLDWLRRVLPSALPGDEGWEPRAVASLLEALLDMRRQLTLQVLAHSRAGAPISEALHAFAAEHPDQLDAVAELINDIRAVPQPNLPGLLVLMRELGRLARQTAK